MTSTDFTYILQHPETISSKQTNALESILDEFPYFQPARALHLKGLKTTESFKYNQALKSAAAYTSDRSILFDFITSDVFLQNEVSEYIKQSSEHLKDIDVDVLDISVNKKTSIDDTLKQQIDDTEGALDPELFQPKAIPSKITSFTLDKPDFIKHSNETDSYGNNFKESKSNTNSPSPESILELGKPLEFNKTETHSFNEWLKLAKFNPVKRTETKEIQTEANTTKAETSIKPLNKSETTDRSISCSKKAKKFELIDKFISSSPKIDPKKSSASSNHNLAESSMLPSESLMTETLARIYVEQKNYKKAIQSYNILSLKYPEKSGFFADRIKAIKKIQEQNNKN